MKHFRISNRIGRTVATGLVSAAAALGSAQAGTFDACPTFDNCTAGVSNYTNAATAFLFSAVAPGYVLPPGHVAGVDTTVQDVRQSTSTAPLIATVGDLNCPNSCGSQFFGGFARAATQTDFGVNRALGRASYGGSGIDTQGGGFSAGVRLTNFADAVSVWNDVWTFSGDGRARATIALDGRSGFEGDSAGFPTGFVHGPSTVSGFWEYDFSVWDLGHLVPDVEGALVPTLVANLNYERPIESALIDHGLALDFAFEAGESYLITSRLETELRDGGYIDLYNTVRLGAVALSDGASLSALSGHDYLAVTTPVPEPETWMSMLAGGLALIGVCRRRARARAQR